MHPFNDHVYMIHTLVSSGVGVVYTIVKLELCHRPHIIVLIIVILCGLGGGEGS